MRKHPQQFEKVFSEDRKSSTSKIKTENINIEGMSITEYTMLFHNFLKDFYDDLFLKCVQLSWLRRKFTYANSKAKYPFYLSTRSFQGNFNKFIRRFIGNDIQIITKGYFFSTLENYYFDILFPGFMDGDPFENPDYYKFPYNNISIEYLMLIYQLDDRLELLKEADDKKMSYAGFLDYVINHIYSENEVLGRDRYSLYQGVSRHCPLYFRDTDKKLKPEKGSKRI